LPDRVDVDAIGARDAGLGLAYLEPNAYLVLSLRCQPEPFRGAPRDFSGGVLRAFFGVLSHAVEGRRVTPFKEHQNPTL
jgi:hypothetical protein